ncbi:hypothetical protein HPB49_001894 [Dermacentor silvarum]|uniref:Uncharacterized protein n=1 Tax=Dermacentor silvarum TaxID=543639 RepID=A0ACB8CD03_DERSI|nr:hypothetical protein HPB49_001894 [Dermacentor silvarum]
MAKLKLKQAFKMDASAFYGSARLEDHSRSRRRVGTSSAEQFLLKIANGNVSDGDFSDDELDETVEITPQESERPASGIAHEDSEEEEPAPAPPEPPQPKRKKKAEVKWIDKDFTPTSTDCTFSHQEATTLLEPLEYFLKYFPADMFSELAKFTNIYALQQEGVELQTTADEMKVFFGIMMRMAVLKYPRIRMYWQEDTKVPTIADTMSCKRFFKLRAMLHVTDVNSPRDPTPDKFWKVRPIISAIQTQCLKLVPLPDQSIDEQMIPFTGRVVAKQFVKGKPNPEGIKVFVRCSADGLAHDLEIYQGKGTGVSENHFHLGLGGSVVMRLVEHAPHGHNIRVYMDNYFSSVPLLRELKELGILASGTIRSNRLLGCPLKSDKELKQTGRGSYDRKVSEEGDIVIVRWHDNGPVNMVSTITGIGELSKVKRWSESLKQHVEIDCPEVISQYNSFMGGVDKLDFLMSLYPLKAKTKKWPVRVISHFVTFAICNGWIEYIRDAKEEGISKKDMKDVMAFQTDVARSLIAINKSERPKRGRPSSAVRPSNSRKAHNSTPMPTNSTRYDGINHWPRHVATNFAQRCKNHGCTSRSRVCCRKCEVFLCLSAANDCFYEFHTKI